MQLITPTILKFLREIFNLRNSQKFSPTKISLYTVVYTVDTLCTELLAPEIFVYLLSHVLSCSGQAFGDKSQRASFLLNKINVANSIM